MKKRAVSLLVPEGVVVWELAHLVGRGCDEPLLIVSQVHRPEASEPVEDPEIGAKRDDEKIHHVRAS